MTTGRTTTEVPPLRRNRDFLLLWTGSAVSSLGSNASSIAYPLLVLALTGSPLDAGFAGFVALLPQLLFQLPAGVLVDRFDRKRVMIWCDVLRATVLATVVVALVADRLTLVHVLAAGLVEGMLTVCFKIAAAAAVRNVVHPTHLTAALSRNEARERAGAMLGQPLGGILFGLGRAVPFLFDAITYLVSLGALLMIRTPFQRTRRGERVRFTAGVSWLWRNPFLRATTFLVASSNLLFRALFLAVIVIAADNGASAGEVGVMLGLAAVGGVVGSLLAPVAERRLSMRTVVIAANWAWAGLVPMVLLVRDPLAIGAIYAFMCFIGPLWNVAISAYQIAVTPDHIQGRVLAAAGMVAFGAIPLGSLVGGAALGWFGTTATVAGLAVWMVLIALFATASPAVRNAPRPAEAAELTEPARAPVPEAH
ncbi:MAG TPA: MFS transporter [Actinophytocola sp.]|nr:MFS transporter [Actinophytocola sp.]